MIYRFEDIEIDTDRFELRQGGEAQKVEPQVFALIELLVSNHGRLVSKDELNLRIWGGRVVSDAVVNSRIRSARRAIGDDGKAQRLIKTVHNRGFRFIGAPVAEDTVVKSPTTAADDGPGAETTEAGEPPVTAGRPSIAVLPFQMLSTDQRYDMVADAVAHEVIVELSRLHWLFVIARGSSFRFRGPDVDLRVASGVLGVRYFLTGSVAIDGRRSIVTVELSDAGNGGVLWADRIEGAVDDLLGLRLTIAAHIVTALEFRIPILEANRAASLPTANLDSWSAYHRGLWHMYRFNAHDNDIAAHMFGRAITADPTFARAHAGLSFTHFQNAFVGYTKDTDGERRLAREEAERSMELDPLDPFANLTMGRAEMLAGDLDSSLSWFDRCVDLNPNYAFAIYNRALADAVSGSGSESEQGVMKAMSLSPIDPLHYAMLATRGLSHIVREDYAAASAWADRGAKAPNAHVHIRVIAALANELAGNREGSERWASEVRRTVPGYKQAKFLEAFPFRDERTRAVVKAALKRLAL
jgi:TolB-like protein/Tfp pilus assembly protein PilF